MMRDATFRSLLHSAPLLGALALLAAAPAAIGAIALASIDTRIEGLPAGLQVYAATEQPCVAPGIQGAFPMAEQTTTTWEPVTAASGAVTLAQRTRTTYVAQLLVPLPLQAGSCTTPYVKFHLGVLGDGAVRWTQIGHSFSPGTMGTLYRTMEALTVNLVKLGSDGLNAGRPTVIDRSTGQTWLATYGDTMGTASVVEPTLDFVVQTNQPFFGATASRGRISIGRDGKVCVRAASGTVCRMPTEGGSVVNGGISVDVRETRHSTSVVASTQWRFALTSSFPAGDVIVRAGADDADPFAYIVDGIPTPLHLLPWKVLSVPVQVN